MPTAKTSARSNRGRWIIAVTSIVVLLSAAFWFWPTSRVTLDDDGYQMTIALYRICNQQDQDALTEIDRKFRVSPELQDLSAQSQQAVTTIIAQAKAGDWKDAAITCRQMMDDQVKY